MKPWILFEFITSIPHESFITGGDDVQYLVQVFPDEKTIRLIFDYTVGKTDLKNDFRFPIKPYKNQENTLWLARGWADAYKSCNDEIMNLLISTHNSNPDYRIEICGWSYGGAMSLVAAEDFYYRTKIKPDIMTFGAPKPLFGSKTKKYVASCCNEVKQYRHRSDIIPCLPPFIGYTNLRSDWLGYWNPFAIFNPPKYHWIYKEEKLYKE